MLNENLKEELYVKYKRMFKFMCMLKQLDLSITRRLKHGYDTEAVLDARLEVALMCRITFNDFHVAVKPHFSDTLIEEFQKRAYYE